MTDPHEPHFPHDEPRQPDPLAPPPIPEIPLGAPPERAVEPIADVIVPELGETPPRKPDPGSPAGARLALIALLILIPSVVVLQQVPHFMPLFQQWGLFQPEPEEEPDSVEVAELASAPGDEQFEIVSRMLVKVADAFRGTAEKGGSNDAMFFGQLVTSATNDGDLVRLAICEAELLGADNATDRLMTIKTDDDELRFDVDLLLSLFADGPDSLVQDERDRLITRFGWHGELALIVDAPAENAARADLLAGGALLLTTLLIFAGLIGLVGFGGFVFGILAIIQVATGSIRPAFVPPAVGGSVYIEMLLVFVAGFVLVQLLGVTAGLLLPENTAITVGLLLQWLLIGLLAYPMLRGVPRARAAHDLGWHKGKGVVREIFAGIAGYLAGIPVLVAAMILTLIIVTLWTAIITPEGELPQAPTNPLADSIQNLGWVQFLLLFSLATIWAPLVEETVFRGAVFRHLRGRMPWIAAGACSALLFGLMHGYFILMLLPVMTLGLIFSAVREWRGSLIGPVVAHFLHNATLMTFVAILVRYML